MACHTNAHCQPAVASLEPSGDHATLTEVDDRFTENNNEAASVGSVVTDGVAKAKFVAWACAVLVKSGVDVDEGIGEGLGVIV